MPIYEYRCDKGHKYELWESFGAPTEQRCPRCGGPARRLLSLPAVIFKGPGFYSTDNRKPGASEEASKEEPPAETESTASV